MTMISHYLIKIAEEAVGNLEKYANLNGYDEGFIETYYHCVDGSTHDLFNSFPGKIMEMDWASWLKVASKKELLEIFDHRGITKVSFSINKRDENGELIWDGDNIAQDCYTIPVSDLPDDGLYGAFDVEMY